MGFPVFPLKMYFYKTENWTIINVHFSKFSIKDPDRVFIIYYLIQGSPNIQMKLLYL